MRELGLCEGREEAGPVEKRKRKRDQLRRTYGHGQDMDSDKTRTARAFETKIGQGQRHGQKKPMTMRRRERQKQGPRRAVVEEEEERKRLGNVKRGGGMSKIEDFCIGLWWGGANEKAIRAGGQRETEKEGLRQRQMRIQDRERGS